MATKLFYINLMHLTINSVGQVLSIAMDGHQVTGIVVLALPLVVHDVL